MGNHLFFLDVSSSPYNIIQPPQAKEKALQKIYDYLTPYFAPKPRQRGSSQADSGESQEQSADHDGADLSPGVAGGEGDENQIDCDPYDVESPNGDNQALVESQERLCWSLGGDVRKTPTPSEDFESLALASPEPPKLELPVEGTPVTKETMDLVQQRIAFLQQLGWLQNTSLFFHSNSEIDVDVCSYVLDVSTLTGENQR